eukprot:scaffold243_cov140-Skeletonema_menzelii.AAC.11
MRATSFVITMYCFFLGGLYVNFYCNIHSPAVAAVNRPVKPVGSGVPLFTTHPDCRLWKFSKQWQDLGYDTECMDNTKVQQMVASYCKHSPREMIQYADIARLLILYENGGWYVDSDVRPTPRCGILQSFPQTTFGLESDFETKTQADNEGMLQQSLSLWAIYGVKGDKRLLQNACILSSLAEQKKNPGESQHHYILRTTGPTSQTQLWNGTVLPISVFGCGQGHSGSPPCSALSCWGCHEFKGRWIRDKELARYSNLLASRDMNINFKFYSLCAMISSWSQMFSGDHKEIRLVTDVLDLPMDVDIVELPKSDDSTGIQLLFKKEIDVRSAYSAAYSGKDDKNNDGDKKKEMEETIKEGGIQVMINKTPNGDLEVIAKRCEVEEDTIIKEMSEQIIINSLGQAIVDWKKENGFVQ